MEERKSAGEACSKEIEAICRNICNNEGRFTEDEEKDLIRLESCMVDEDKTDLGFPKCADACMANRFAHDVERITNVTLTELERCDDALSIPNCRSSLAFKGKYKSMDVLVDVYNYWDTEKEHCPCRVEDGRFSFIIGSMNKNPLAIPVYGYCWNKNTRVLWIVTPYCEAEKDVFFRDVSTQCSLLEDTRFHLNPGSVAPISAVKVSPGESVEEEDLEAKAEGRVRPRVDAPVLDKLYPYQLLRCEQAFWFRGNYSFAQRQMEIISVMSFFFHCVCVVPELFQFWCVEDPFRMPSKMHKDVFRDKCMQKKYWFHDHPGDFELFAKLVNTDDNEYIFWNSFYEVVQQYGFLWLDFRSFHEMNPTLLHRLDAGLLKRPDLVRECQEERKRFYFFVVSQEDRSFVDVVFTEGSCKGVPFSSRMICFDTISRKFHILGLRNIFGDTPLRCLENFVSTFDDGTADYVLEQYPVETPAAPPQNPYES